MRCFGSVIGKKGCLDRIQENNKRGNIDFKYRLILHRRLFCKVEQRNKI